MASLVENLRPPFYIAIINDNVNLSFIDEGISPTEKMVSIAPHQPGFLGLETKRDKKGKWVTISYWSDMDSEKAWEQNSDNQIRKYFNGIALKETCAIRVSKINRKIRSSKKLYAGALGINDILLSSSIIALITGSFSVIAHMLRCRAVN